MKTNTTTSIVRICVYINTKFIKFESLRMKTLYEKHTNKNDRKKPKESFD